MKRTLAVIALVSTVIGNSRARTEKTVSISVIAAAGTVTNTNYRNSFLKLAVDAPNATLKLNPLVNESGGRARLVQILSKRTIWENTYTFAVLADILANYPQLRSETQYVRSVRHQLEREGLPTVREEFPITIDGTRFIGAILQEQTPNGHKYYRGFYTTFRDGVIVSFDAEAASENKLNGLVKQLVKLGK